MSRPWLWLSLGALALLALGGGGVVVYSRLKEEQDNEARLLPLFTAAEKRYGLPAGLLHRMAYQESHFRTDIINGTTVSPVGAIGVMQFMPATAASMGIDPREPAQSIDAAGRYMQELYRQFGDWPEAVAAYNWGPGNVARHGLDNAPAETVAYYQSILGDLGISYA